MRESSYFDAPVWSTRPFSNLTGIEWDALNHLVEISGGAFVTSLMRSATPDGHRLAKHEFMARELADFNHRGLTPSRPSRSNAVKMETSYYSENGTNQLSLN